jgi:hypothetical protein
MLEGGLEELENGIILDLRRENESLSSQINDYRNEVLKNK